MSHFEMPAGIQRVVDWLASDPLRVADYVRLRTDRIYSGIPYMPDVWSAKGGGSDVARVITITDYHNPCYYGYTGIDDSSVSRKVEVMFPNGETLMMPFVEQFEIIPNGDPLR